MCLGLLIVININGHVSEKYDGIYKLLESYSSEKLIDDGDVYYERGIMDTALIYYTLVADRYTKEMPANHKKICMHAYHNSGNVYYIMRNYVQAQNMYFKALELGQESGDSLQNSRTYNNLGSIYAVFNDFRKARDYYIKAYEGVANSSDRELKIKILNNLLGVCSNLRDNEQLKHYFNISEQIQQDDSVKSIFYYFAKGWMKQLDGDPVQAVEYQKKALKIADSLNLSPQYTCSALNNISEAFNDMQQNDSVEYYLKKCADIAVREGLLDVQINVYRELSDIYSEKKNLGQFFYYAKLYQQINDSIKSVQGYQNIRNMELLFEVNQLGKFITSIQEEQMLKEVRLKNQQQILYIIGGAFLIAISLLIAVYFQKQALLRSYREIFMRNKEIIASEKQAKEFYHAYRNEIRKKDEEIACLQKEVRELVSLPIDTGIEDRKDDIVEEEVTVKYQGSSLTKEQKEKILHSITEVMDNTLEFCNPDFTLERMALLIHSRPKHVSQVINEMYGKNFNRYVNEYRIKEARLRLMDIEKYGNYTVKGIAQSVGFRSNSNFNSLFKELTGITPSVYQEMANS